MLKEKKRADLAEAEAEKARQDLADAEKAMEAERSNLKSEAAKFHARMEIAQRIVASHVPQHQLAMSQAESAALRAQLARQGREALADAVLTPRPNFLRASQHVPLATDGGRVKPSRLVVDELCERLEFACGRYKRIEARLCRRFVRVQPAQVDRFFFEPPEVQGLALECLFCSYSAPADEPRWRREATRARALARGRLSGPQFQDLLAELGLSARAPPDECLRAFRESASGGGGGGGGGAAAADLSYVEFRLLLARVAVIAFSGEHHTHEDLRDLVHDLCEFLALRRTDAFLSRLEALEPPRWRAAQARAGAVGAPPPAAPVAAAPKRGSQSR